MPLPYSWRLRCALEGQRVIWRTALHPVCSSRTTFYEQARRFMDRCDLLLTPTMPCAAWSVDRGPERIGGRPAPTMFDRLPFTHPFNLTGWPAATVPCGFTSEGLPVGLQIVANRHQDALCLRASAAFEAAQPWAQVSPSLARPT